MLVRVLPALVVYVLFASCGSDREIVEMPAGKVGLIGYGSLTSSAQMEVQLGKPYAGPPVRVVHLEGYTRRWNAVFPNDAPHPPNGQVVRCVQNGDTLLPETIIALNIQPYAGAELNACFFVIDESDLATIDRTETSYRRFEVTDAIREFAVMGGTVYAYTALPEYTVDPETGRPRRNVLPALYLDFLNAAVAERGATYREEFAATTQPIPEDLILPCAITDPVAAAGNGTVAEDI